MAQFEIPEVKLMLEELRLLRAEVKELHAKMDCRSGGEWLTRAEIRKKYTLSSTGVDRGVKAGTIEKMLAFGPQSPRYRLKEGARL